MRSLCSICLLAIVSLGCPLGSVHAQTVALWLFDESMSLYPSHVLADHGPLDYPLVLGRGGSLAPGRFGHALSTQGYGDLDLPEGDERFGMATMAIPPGRTAEPMNWRNAFFAGLMCSGENHLRKQVGFANALETKLNLGAFDWTVEFWLLIDEHLGAPGVVFELGRGPLRADGAVTRLSLSRRQTHFILENAATASKLFFPLQGGSPVKQGQWSHHALVHDAGKNRITYYRDGRVMHRSRAKLKSLAPSDEAYLSLARAGNWSQRLPGKLDELHFYAGQKYRSGFDPPESYASKMEEVPARPVTEPLLFDRGSEGPISLGRRKHLFIDGAFLESPELLKFNVNPPKKAEQVIGDIQGPFRKHLTVLEDEQGVIRIYNSVERDYLAVHTSTDGVHFVAPDLGRTVEGRRNIVIDEINGGMGTPFIDPAAPAQSKFKFLTDFNRRGIYLYTSPDGFQWTRQRTAIVPFRSGSQSCTFYDEQRGRYVAYHRTDMQATPAGATLRGTVLTEMEDISQPVAYAKLNQADYQAASDTLILREPQPWFLDNGPLTPGGLGLEFPLKFRPTDADPIGTDIYVSKAMKYPGAPDTYLAFPIVYFHYEEDGPPTRLTLMDEERGLGSGPLETQVAVSRDGIHWTRKYRPAYVGIGAHAGHDVVTAYLAHGMVIRGDEIWQYYFGEDYYHSPWQKSAAGRGVYRVVQRLDGFVSMDSPYDREVTVRSRVFTFAGQGLFLNVDTDAAGYVQIGFEDPQGNPIAGYGVDDCIYVNGDFIETPVEWTHGFDIAHLAGRELRLVFRMRGSKLYALQFK